MTETTNQSVQI